MISEEEYQDLDQLFAKAVSNEELLTDYENAFASSFTDRLSQYRRDIRISPKQQTVVDSIREKLKQVP